MAESMYVIRSRTMARVVGSRQCRRSALCRAGSRVLAKCDGGDNNPLAPARRQQENGRLVSETVKEVDMAKAKNAVPEGHHTITPQLTLDNAAQAIEWYKQALGAEEMGRALGPDGKVMHAELRIGDSRVMLNDAMMGGKGPQALGGSPMSLWLYVDDCDALFNRAVKAGGQVARGGMGEMQDQFWGDRSGTFTDPHGYTWTIATHKEDLTPEEMQQRQDAFMKQFAAQH
jgi:PhnB protein